jgi:tRNA (guanine37-N1)-methyltransferase
LEYPQYTRPEIYGTLQVPEPLLSGHHENIRRWRRRKQVEKTLALRPDLIRWGEEAGIFDEETRKLIAETRKPQNQGEV